MATNRNNNDDASSSKRESKDESNCCWYFAIGAMMNPISMSHRNVVPLESFAGELMDYKLHFFGPLGLAEAVERPGKSIHGVLHRMSHETMCRLDKIEVGYVRQEGRARLYNGEFINNATFYTRQGDDNNTVERGDHVDKPPSERYLQLLISGAKHFGVAQSHVEFLKKHDSQPRLQPHEFKSFSNPLPGAAFMPLEDVLIANGVNEDQPLRLTINSKVMELDVERNCREWNDYSGHVKEYGQHMELFLSKAIYDPKYGIPKQLQDVTREHSAYLEDLMYRFIEGRGLLDRWKTVAKFDQEYAD